MSSITSTRQPSTQAVTAIVFENRPRWVPELERQFADEEVRIVACRSLRDVSERSAGVTRGLIVLDLHAAPGECLKFLEHRWGKPGTLPVFAVGSERTAALEWPLRELGVTAFFAGPIPGHEMAGLCRRQWQQGTVAVANSGDRKQWE